jgi:threonine/homoserine/homoserine lactone efflux protein
LIAYIAFGATYAFAAAVQPGPLQAYVISLALRGGWRRALPAAAAPLISDAPIILLVLFVLTRLPATFVSALRLGGGLFLLYLAWRAFSDWRNYTAPTEGSAPSARRGLFSAVTVNLLNPAPYLGWSLIMGPRFLEGWRESPANGIAMIVAFYGTIVLTTAGIIAIFSTARELGPVVTRAMVGISAIALALFGLYQLGSGATGLLPG